MGSADALPKCVACYSDELPGYFFFAVFLVAFLTAFFTAFLAAFFVAIEPFSLFRCDIEPATRYVAANECIESVKIHVKKKIHISEIILVPALLKWRLTEQQAAGWLCLSSED